jgi:hypothetical protein
MSSTDDFFRERLVVAAERLRQRGVRFFALGPEPADTWWVPVAHSQALEPLSDPAARLKELWADVPELAELADELLALAEAQRPTSESDGSVTPLIYVMF